MTAFPIRRALLSVSDKDGIVDLAQGLADHGVTILSTGGTAKLLKEKDIPVTEVSDFTASPEIMDGRVKTLHPKIHGGILARRDTDQKIMDKHGIEPIDLVVVNLYPFAATISKPDCTDAEAIENIDIGGPTMLRAAAKNHAWVTVVVDPGDYPGILAEIHANDGSVSDMTRRKLAVKCFEHTAQYEDAIANYLGSDLDDDGAQRFPRTFNAQYLRSMVMRYGENPHQRAAFFHDIDAASGTLASARQLQGKDLSFNNVADADAALECVKSFDDAPHACVIVKHANPCGVAIADTQEDAYRLAFATDPVSSFGGIIAFNRELSAESARCIIDNQFVEVIIAPEVHPDARDALSDKSNVRVLETGPWQAGRSDYDIRRVSGGVLIQERDYGAITEAALKVATRRKPDEKELHDLLFAWRVCKHVKSNAIVFAREGRTLGIGAGQMSRVDSVRIAVQKAADAELDLTGASMASDAFFPFSDGVENAARAGIRSVIQPGGSMRDDEVVAAADAADLAMVMTGMRHFRH